MRQHPTVVERLIQQALVKLLQPLVGPSFSKQGHWFGPGFGTHDADWLDWLDWLDWHAWLRH